MKTHNAKQGSVEWNALRASVDGTASEAPVMMGASKYQSRDELLKQKSTGEIPEVSSHQQKIFGRGHNAEESARPIIEGIIGEELYPVTGSIEIEGLTLLASCDGLTMLEDLGWEHKLFNASLFDDVSRASLDPHYYWQLEQQLLVTGAEKTLFTVSDGTQENMISMEYFPVPGRREELIAGWHQFAKDLAAYEFKTEVVEPQSDAIKDLPALVVQITGGVQASNLPEFKAKSIAFIEAINTDLQTDQDFANAESAVKFLNDSEKKIELVKEQAIEQTPDIAELFRVMDEIKQTMRKTRLSLDKQVGSQKDLRKAEMIKTSRLKLTDHIDSLMHSLGGDYMPNIPADFAGAIKGKRSLETMQGAINDELARAKIEANKIADNICANLAIFDEMVGANAALFTDKAGLLLSEPDHLKLIISDRIRTHEEAQAKLKAEQEAEQKALEAPVKFKCDGNHGGPRCEDTECWNDDEHEVAQAALMTQSSQIGTFKQNNQPVTDPDAFDIATFLRRSYGLESNTALRIANDLISGNVPHVSHTQKAA